MLLITEANLYVTNLYVTDHREFSAIRNESNSTMKYFIDQKLKVDRNTSKYFTLFIKFSATDEEIRDVHRFIAPDSTWLVWQLN